MKHCSAWLASVIFIFLVFTGVPVYGNGSGQVVDAQDSLVNGVVFEPKSFFFADSYWPYRRCGFNVNKEEGTSLIVYLHGGSARGGDNGRQLKENGLEQITEYVKNKGMSAVIVVPQCPAEDPQGAMMDWVKMKEVIVNMIAFEKPCGSSKVYIFGGSMGGAAIWDMLSLYPDLFASAMICAANPRTCSASNVAKTPVYVVAGSADRLMGRRFAYLDHFLDMVGSCGGKCRLDVEQGWDHRRTCEESYTAERLDWVFSYICQHNQ